MPSKVFYKPVNVKVERTINRKQRVDLNQRFIDEKVLLEEIEIEPEPEPRDMREMLKIRHRRAIVYDVLADLQDNSEEDSDEGY